MKNHKDGFTIVELLIVIVVIAILAAISIVAYNGIQDRALNTARMTELRGWSKQFELYYAQEGRYPPVSNGTYCLGTGFPDNDGSGLGNCRNTANPPTRAQVNPTLNAELAKVGSLPSGPRKIVTGDLLGPYAAYYSSSYIHLTSVFKGDTCPDGTSSAYAYPDGSANICIIVASKD